MAKKLIVLWVFLLLQGSVLALTLTSPAFKNNESIPPLYTCDGKDISPELNWTDVPANTKSFVLIMTDIDAHIAEFDHWVLFNLPGTMRKIKQNQQHFPNGVIQGNNTWGVTNYRGPCPPLSAELKEHRYYFKLYALDTSLIGLATGATSAEVRNAMQGHMLAEADLMGRYKKIVVR